MSQRKNNMTKKIYEYTTYLIVTLLFALMGGIIYGILSSNNLIAVVCIFSWAILFFSCTRLDLLDKLWRKAKEVKE